MCVCIIVIYSADKCVFRTGGYLNSWDKLVWKIIILCNNNKNRASASLAPFLCLTSRV